MSRHFPRSTSSLRTGEFSSRLAATLRQQFGPHTPRKVGEGHTDYVKRVAHEAQEKAQAARYRIDPTPN